MSQASSNDARERQMRSLDIIRVHNNTSEDFVFWSDKFGSAPQRVIVPKAQKDIGKGKGNNDLPRYLAQRYVKNMIEAVISKEADIQTKKRKAEIRQLPKAEQLDILEREIIRTNDANKWKELVPVYWLGVIEKYGGSTIPEPVDSMTNTTGNRLHDVLTNNSLADKPYSEGENE